MESEEIPQDPEPDEARSRLAEGLRSCRAVVESYRTMIANEPAELDATDPLATSSERLPDPDAS